MGAAAEPPLNEARLNFLSGWAGQPSFSPHSTTSTHTFREIMCQHLLN